MWAILNSTPKNKITKFLFNLISVKIICTIRLSELNHRRQEYNVDFSSKTKDQMSLTSHQEDCFQSFSNLQLNSAEG